MSRRWIVLALALLCFAQVWSKPTEKSREDSDSDYPGDDGEGADYDDSEAPISAAGPVDVITKPQMFYVAPGGQVTLPCVFINADGVMTRWLKGMDANNTLYADNLKLATDPRIDRLNDNSLVIKNANIGDNSDYVCEALALNATNNKVVHKVIVQEAGNNVADGDETLVRVTPAEHYEIDQGGSVMLGCEVSESIKPERMAWSREGNRIKRIKQTPNGIYLDVRSANRHLAGDYQCLVEIGSPNPIIKHLRFSVRHIPEIEYEKEQLQYREVDKYYTGIGANTTITCVVHSHPGITKLQWFHNDKKVKLDSRIHKSESRKSHHSLTIVGTTKEDLGDYYCRAWNVLGNATGPIIHVRDTPDQPLFKRGQVVDDAIEFQWRVNSYSPIVQAELEYRKEGEWQWVAAQDIKVISQTGKENIVQGRIRGIEAGKYEARLRARNDAEHITPADSFEWGPYSEIKKFDGEYKEDSEAESVRGSSIRPTVSFMALLLLIVAPFAYSSL